MAEKQVKFLKWLGDPDTLKLPMINRVIADVEFNGPDHVGRVEGADKIKFFTDGPLAGYFEESTEAEYTLNGGKEVDVLLDAVSVGAEGASAGGTAQGPGGNGVSTGSGTL
jgi:hypothetical protein